MSTFYTTEELKTLGLKSYGEEVYISRNAILYNPELLELGHDVRIDDFATISGKVKMGSYIHIAQFVSLYGGDAGIEMADFSAVANKSTVYATSNDYTGESLTNPMVPAKFKTTDKNAQVYIGKHVVVGCHSVILPGVSIGDYSSVGAMSLCNKSLDGWGVFAGSPARLLRPRSKKLLELEREFYADRKAAGLPE